MLDETIDTMALAMASFTLDQAEQELRAAGKDDVADALSKLQIDAGYHMAAISAGFETPEDFIEQKIRPNDGKLEEALTEDVIAQIKNFEPLTRQRLQMLVTIASILPDSDLRNDLNALNEELAQSAPASFMAQVVKHDNLTP